MVNPLRYLFVLLFLAAALPAVAQDSLTIGTTSASAGSTVAVPVYLQDSSGTPLGTDRGAGNRIQSISLQINFGHAVTSASFRRAGVLAGLTPAIEVPVNGSGSFGWLGSFQESTQPIPLTANAPLPGNRIGTFVLTLANGLTNGSTVALTFNPANTLLSNQGGTVEESTFNQGLKLTDGSITIGGAATTTTFNTAPNPSGIGQPVTLTAWVGSGTAGTITGFVSFYDDLQLIGFSALQDGQATLTNPLVTLGGHNISATYEGDASYHPSTADSLVQSVGMYSTPTNVVATGTSATTATITWTPIGEAMSYEVRRRVNNGSWTLVGSPVAASFNDSALIPNSEYLYEVRAVFAGSGSSADSAPDLASTFTFSDDPVVAGTTPVRSAHLTELRTAVNALRSTAGLLPAAFTDPSLGLGSSIRKLHIEELRAAILPARAALGLSTPAFADPTLTAQSTPVKALHIQQLRAVLK